MANFNLFVRDPKSTKPTPIYLDIRYDNNNCRLVYPTGEKIEPEYWDKEDQRPARKGRYRNQTEFRLRLDNLLKMSKEVMRAYLNDNEQKPPTVDQLRNLLDLKLQRKVKPKEIDLFSFIDELIDEAPQRINEKTGRPLNSYTIKGYKTTQAKLVKFKEEHKKYKFLDFNSVNLEFYNDFVIFLKNQRYSTNYISAIIKNLKVFLNEATERGINTNLDFRSSRFKKVTEEVDAIYLTQEELKRLFILDLSGNTRLERVRDLMIVGCWTGLRFSDFTKIMPRHIVRDNDGLYIEIQTQKTMESVVIPIHPMVENIMDRYQGKTDNSLPPSISNQRMNKYLKEIGLLAELNELVGITRTEGGVKVTRQSPKYQLLRTHTARRTFATNAYLMGLPTYDIMRITGHRSETIFFKYIKITPRESAKKLRQMWQQAI